MGQKQSAIAEENNRKDGYMESGVSDPNQQLAVDFCGVEHCRPGYRFGPLSRSVYIIHVVLGGRGILRYRGNTYEIGMNQIFLLPPGEKTSYVASQTEPWHYAWVAFHGHSAEEIVRRIGFTRSRPVVNVKKTKSMEMFIRKIMQYQERTTVNRMICTGLLYQLLAVMIAENDEEGSCDIQDQYLLSYSEYAEKYIRLHYREKIRIGHLAQHIGISRSYLVKVMKEAIGMSPQEYLIKVRMEHAAHLLNHTNDAIRDIAYNCGYDDSLAFSKAFKHAYGTNPSDFRKQYRDEHMPEDEGPIASSAYAGRKLDEHE